MPKQFRVIDTGVRPCREQMAFDLLGVAGYFTALSMLMNAVHTPPPSQTEVPLLSPFPL